MRKPNKQTNTQTRDARISSNDANFEMHDWPSFLFIYVVRSTDYIQQMALHASNQLFRFRTQFALGMMITSRSIPFEIPFADSYHGRACV